VKRARHVERFKQKKATTPTQTPLQMRRSRWRVPFEIPKDVKGAMASDIHLSDYQKDVKGATDVDRSKKKDATTPTQLMHVQTRTRRRMMKQRRTRKLYPPLRTTPTKITHPPSIQQQILPLERWVVLIVHRIPLVQECTQSTPRLLLLLLLLLLSPICR
jgi:hypothetical protein